MKQGLDIHQRTLLVQQAAMFVFEGDVGRFIETGQLRKRKRPKTDPAVEAKIAEIHANGGRLIIEPQEDTEVGEP
jgi:hypothetical protein